MELFIKVLPLIIQLVEALFGAGQGKQKLGAATRISHVVLTELALAGKVPMADAHETGYLQSMIHATVERMKSYGELDEDKPIPVIKPHFSSEIAQGIYKVPAKEIKIDEPLVDFSKLGLK